MAEVENTVDIPKDTVDIPEEDTLPTTNHDIEKEEWAKLKAMPHIQNLPEAGRIYDETRKQNLEDVINQGAEEYRSAVKVADAEILYGASQTLPPEGQAVVAEAVKLKEQTDFLMPNEIQAIKGNLLKVEGMADLPMKEVDNISLIWAVKNSLARRSDERAWYSTVSDFTGMVFWDDVSINTSDTLDKVRERLVDFGVDPDKLTGSYIDSAEDIRVLGELIKELPTLEMKADLINLIEKEYYEFDGNTLKFDDFMRAILGEKSFLEIEHAIDKAGLAGTLATAGASVIQKIIKAAQIVTTLGKARNYEDAMTVSDMAAQSPETARAVGSSQIDSSNTGNPIKDIFEGAPEGASNRYRHHSNKIEDELGRLESIYRIDVTDYSPQEIKDLTVSLRRRLPKDQEVDDVRLVREADNKVTIKYNLLDEDGNLLEQVSKPYTIDDVGSFKDDNIGWIPNALNALASPKFRQGEDGALLVDSAFAGISQSAKVKTIFSKAMEKAWAPVRFNKKSVDKLDKLFKELDGKEIIPTYQKLVIEGIGGIKLTEKEFMSFTSIRRILDEMWAQTNKTIREEMEFNGIKSIMHDGGRIYGKPYESAQSAAGAYFGETKAFPVLKDGSPIESISKESLEEAYSKGYVLVKSKSGSNSLDDMFSTGKGESKEHFNYALVPKEDVRALPNVILNKTPNYLPKVNKDANWFIREKRSVMVDGELVKKPITVGYSATRVQANYGKQQRVLMDKDRGVETEYFVEEDVKLDTAPTGDVVSSMGGLVRGKRSKEGLTYYGDFGGGRADSLESIQRAIAHTSDRMAMSRWREAAQRRWLNSAGRQLENVPQDFKIAREAIEREMPVGDARTKLLSAHDHISSVSMIPTKGEQTFKGLILNAARKLDREFDINVKGIRSQKLNSGLTKGSQLTSSYMYHIKDKNPVDLMKSATFNLTLGAFSMVQIPVQAAGVLVAVAANPIYAGKAVDKWLIASALDLGSDLKVVKETASIVGKRMGMDKDTVKSLQNDYAFWRDSGMRESVVRGNADASSLMNGMPIDAGLIRRGFHGFLEAGQTPYRIGELTNMRISFFTALEREKDLAGAAFKYDGATLQRVMGRAEDYRMQMNAANKAAYQRGFMSLPTQFKQIYTKYVEALTGRTLTTQEKIRVFTTQAAAFGAAGVPIVNHFHSQLRSLFGLEPEVTEEGISVDPQLVEAIDNGLVGLMLTDYMDLDISFSGRLTVASDLIEELIRAVADDRIPFIETLVGASATPLKQTFKLIDNINLMILSKNEPLNPESWSKAEVLGIAEVLGEDLLKMSSSGRNYLASEDIREGYVRSSDGKMLISEYEPDERVALFRQVGFNLKSVEDLYEQKRENISTAELVRGRTTQLINAFHLIARGSNENNSSKVEQGKKAHAFVAQIITNLPETEREAIKEAFYKRITNPKNLKEEVINEYIRLSVAQASEGLSVMNSFMAKELQKKHEIGEAFIEEGSKPFEEQGIE